MRNREIREARINDAATKIRVFFLSFLLETVFVEPARTRYTKVSKVALIMYEGAILSPRCRAKDFARVKLMTKSMMSL